MDKWKKVLAMPLLTVCLSACGGNTAQPGKKNTETVSAAICEKAASDKQALSQCHRLAEKGDAAAQYKVASMYYEGKGLSQDIRSAIYWSGHAAKQGNTEAKALHDTALAELEEAVRQGNPNAQFNLAWMHWHGYGLPRDNSKAIDLYEKSAKQGNTEAQYTLGMIYSEDVRFPHDGAKAKDWYEKAAMQGNARAQDNLAVLYRRGRGVPKDEAKAQYWSDKAMLQGDCGTGCR